MRRRLGLLAGILTQILFAWTVIRLFPFLQGTSHGHLSGWFAGRSPIPWYIWNAMLALQFSILHSWLLYPWTRKQIERLVPSPFYGCFFSISTCLCLLAVIELWQPQPLTVWHLTGASRRFVQGAFLLCWPLLIYSLSLTGLGYQTGWTPWWAWARRRKLPRREFEPRGLYHALRHPIYLIFLGLIWLTPTMTIDRAMLTGLWTVYIYVGSCLKDRRLIHYVGDPYREYQSRVRGYPLMLFGPLARVPFSKQPATRPYDIAQPRLRVNSIFFNAASAK